MHTLPPAMILRLRSFAPLFSRRVWNHVQVLVTGAMLAPAPRTVTAALRVMGLGTCPHFQRYHRVLNRDHWSALAASRVLLGLLVTTFAPHGPLVIGADETIERRRGAKIAAKGIYRDAVRSSHSHFVKASGVRWICLMLLVPIPWAGRVWALPFLTALASSERANAARGRRHKTPTDWAQQLLRVVRRWYPERTIVAVADSGYAVLSLLASHTALWYHTGLPPVPLRWVLIRDPHGVFATQALLCTDLTVAPEQIVAWFVLRWQMEVTLEEVRRHLGVETQRQWTDLAVGRTTPALLGLFALVTLLAHPHLIDATHGIWQAAWYRKRAPTFSDALARVRRELWTYEAFCLSDVEAEMVKVPRILMQRLTDTLCYVA